MPKRSGDQTVTVETEKGEKTYNVEGASILLPEMAYETLCEGTGRAFLDLLEERVAAPEDFIEAYWNDILFARHQVMQGRLRRKFGRPVIPSISNEYVFLTDIDASYKSGARFKVSMNRPEALPQFAMWEKEGIVACADDFDWAHARFTGINLVFASVLEEFFTEIMETRHNVVLPVMTGGCWDCKAVKSTDGKSLRSCQRCKAAFYCSVKCQVEHLPTHKRTCNQISSSRTGHSSISPPTTDSSSKTHQDAVAPAAGSSEPDLDSASDTSASSSSSRRSTTSSTKNKWRGPTPRELAKPYVKELVKAGVVEKVERAAPHALGGVVYTPLIQSVPLLSYNILCANDDSKGMGVEDSNHPESDQVEKTKKHDEERRVLVWNWEATRSAWSRPITVEHFPDLASRSSRSASSYAFVPQLKAAITSLRGDSGEPPIWAACVTPNRLNAIPLPNTPIRKINTPANAHIPPILPHLFRFQVGLNDHYAFKVLPPGSSLAACAAAAKMEGVAQSFQDTLAHEEKGGEGECVIPCLDTFLILSRSENATRELAAQVVAKSVQHGIHEEVQDAKIKVVRFDEMVESMPPLLGQWWKITFAGENVQQPKGKGTKTTDTPLTTTSQTILRSAYRLRMEDTFRFAARLKGAYSTADLVEIVDQFNHFAGKVRSLLSTAGVGEEEIGKDGGAAFEELEYEWDDEVDCARLTQDFAGDSVPAFVKIGLRALVECAVGCVKQPLYLSLTPKSHTKYSLREHPTLVLPTSFQMLNKNSDCNIDLKYEER
ncbi:hypothetical protein HK102_001198 [Quaeritorhiza haematococci]|nr:hypothetical protein HK102_001198 [Quaeritorhiza haematococci]